MSFAHLAAKTTHDQLLVTLVQILLHLHNPHPTPVSFAHLVPLLAFLHSKSPLFPQLLYNHTYQGLFHKSHKAVVDLFALDACKTTSCYLDSDEEGLNRWNADEKKRLLKPKKKELT